MGVVGIDPAFRRLFPDPPPPIAGRDCAVSASLARDLGVKAGDSILVNVDRQGAIPSGTLFAHRSADFTLRSLRLNVAAILPDRGAGGFRLDVGSDAPRNVFISRSWLAREIGKDGMANALVARSGWSVRELQKALVSNAALADYGLRIRSDSGCISLESNGLVLTDARVEAARQAAIECGARFRSDLRLPCHNRSGQDEQRRDRLRGGCRRPIVVRRGE